LAQIQAAMGSSDRDLDALSQVESGETIALGGANAVTVAPHERIFDLDEAMRSLPGRRSFQPPVLDSDRGQSSSGQIHGIRASETGPVDVALSGGTIPPLYEANQIDSHSPTQAPGSTPPRVPQPDFLISPATPTPPPLPHGLDYVLTERIGKGGQGEVWAGWQASLAREVALKVPHSTELMEFFQEAYTSGELDHPNIVPVYDLGRMEQPGESPKPILAMKRVRGIPWNKLLAMDRQSPSFRLDAHFARHIPVLLAVCNAVAYAHAKDIIHRDLKPQQVMVGEYGEVYLMDWGLALTTKKPPVPVTREGLARQNSVTTATNRAGSPAYMAPEQTELTTDNLGLHTDVYLLGAILFEIVSGHPPHASSSAQSAFLMAAANELNPIPSDCPAELRDVINRTLSTDIKARPAGVKAFRETLEAYLSGAGRKRESREVTQQVADRLAKAGSDYDTLNDCATQLYRARGLWADNPETAPLLLSTHVRHAISAIDNGDLTLATVVARRIEDADKKSELLGLVAVQQAKVQRQALQRRAAIIAAFVLVLALAGSSAWLAVSQQRIEKQNSDLALSKQALDSQKEQRELFERLNHLRSAEARLAAELDQVAPMPNRLRKSSDSIDFVSEPAGVALRSGRSTADVAELLRQRMELRREREELERLAPGALDSVPYQLLLAEANVRVAKAETDQDYIAAIDLYREAAVERPDLPQPLVGMGIAANYAGQAVNSTKHFELAINLAERSLGPKHAYTAEIARLAGQSFQMLDSESDVARGYFHRSLMYFEPTMVQQASVISEILSDIGQYDVATSYALTALDYGYHVAKMRYSYMPDLRNALQDDTTTEGLSVLQRALVDRYILKGDYVSAEKHLETGLELMESFDAPPEQRLVYLHSVIRLRLSQGRPVEAHAKCLEALAILDQLDREEQSAMRVTILRTLVESMIALGRFPEAVTAAEEAIAVLQASPSRASISVAYVYQSLANASINIGDYDRAMKAADGAYEIFVSSMGELHPNTIQILDMKAYILGHKGDYEASLPLSREALDKYLRVVGPEHPLTSGAYYNLAHVLTNVGRSEEALLNLVRAYLIDKKLLGAHHPETAQTLFKIGSEERRIGDPIIASKLMANATGKLLRALGPDHVLTALGFELMLNSVTRHLNRYERTRWVRHSVVLGKLLEDRYRRDHTITKRELSTIRTIVVSSWMGLQLNMTSVTLIIDPPRRDLRRRGMLRSAAMVPLGEDVNQMVVNNILPDWSGQEPDLAERLLDLATRTDVPEIVDGVTSASAIWPYIDAIEPAIDWEKEFPQFAPFTYDSIVEDPDFSDEAIAPLLDAIVEREANKLDLKDEAPDP